LHDLFFLVIWTTARDVYEATWGSGGKILATEQLGGRVFVTTVVNALAVG